MAFSPLPLRRACAARVALALALGLGTAGCTKTAPSARVPQPERPQPTAAPRAANTTQARPGRAADRRVIVFVWDGLRPDSVDPAVTPELARLRDEQGVEFRNHHAIYPTFTMMNAASFATGALPGRHGFFGNVEYQPGASGHDAKGEPVDFSQPVFTEDHAILQALDAFNRTRLGTGLLRVPTLFEAAHAAGLRTAVIGKAGPAFLQDYREPTDGGVLLDEDVALPRRFALALQDAGLPLPKHSVHYPYADGPIELAADNGDPTATSGPAVTLADGVTADPRATGGSPYDQKNAYLMRVFVQYVLPELDPTLSFVWLRNPDSTEHAYGPGTPNVIDALRHQDKLLGQLLAALDRLGRRDSTDLFIVSDHGHSTVASDPHTFPLRALRGAPDGDATLGAPVSASTDAPGGYSVSGDVRTTALLREAGFVHTYDGHGCAYDPVLSGIEADGQPLYPARQDATCEPTPLRCTPAAHVPRGRLAQDAIVVAANGGSEYFYVPSHDTKLVARLTTALQERSAYGPVFVRSVYGALPGTLPLTRIGLEGPDSLSPPTPDVIVSYDWDELARTAAAPNTPGTEHASAHNARGMHGAFSPRDVHNTLIATGPDLRAGMHDDLPSSNADLAPTLAALLGLSLPHAEGRVLVEALTGPPPQLTVERFEQQAPPAKLDHVCALADPSCSHPGERSTYTFRLYGQRLSTPGGGTHVYFDRAKVDRTQP